MLKKTYHDTGENKLSEEHTGELILVSITLFELMEQLWPKNG